MKTVNDTMRRAYGAARRIVEKERSDEEQELLRSARQSDVIVVEGIYDRVQDVLDLLEVGYHVVPPKALVRLDLEPRQLVVVNCPGKVAARAIPRLRKFVRSGGSLFTTDWALRHIIEPAFPRTIAYTRSATNDDVVRIEIGEHDNPFIDGIFEAGADPVWWLEGSSYPITVLDSGRVQVLMRSKELAKRYGEEPIAVCFEAGEGEVFHMISHYYLQRAETRTARHKGSWKTFAEKKGAPEAYAGAEPEIAAERAGNVEAAYASMRAMQNLVVRQRRRSRERGE